MMHLEIDTPHLRLINCDLALVEAVLAGNAALAAATGLTVPDDWTEFGEPAFRYTQARLLEHPEDAKWCTWLPVVRAENLLVGSCGYVGRPDAEGVVEIGYEIAASRRRLGYASELALALVAHAFTHAEVQKVIAHTLAVHNASTRVLRNCDMHQVAEIEHPEDGLLWKWEITRAAYATLHPDRA
jgi:[ribosomal protein S5]-alanine N-acetyltransferase